MIDWTQEKRGFHCGVRRGVYLECTLTVDSVVVACLMSRSV